MRTLAGTIDNFIDHYRLERDFSHLLDGEDADEDGEEGDDGDDEARQSDAHDDQDGQSELPITETDGNVDSSTPAQKRIAAASERPNRRQDHNSRDEEDDLAPEDMPVTVVVKADSANTLASVLDALGDWGDVESLEQRQHDAFPEEEPGGKAGEASTGSGDRRKRDENSGRVENNGQEWGEHDLQHKQRRRLVVSVARAGVGAVTSSDVRLARDCECPVFAHNVKADASASRELKRVGGGVVPALPEGAVATNDEKVDVGIGGLEGFIGRAGEGKECIVVSETVGELLGEIERFVLRVR